MTTNVKWPSSRRYARAHGRDEVAVVGVLEQVRDDFGVGLGA